MLRPLALFIGVTASTALLCSGLAAAAGTSTLAVSATVLSKTSCRFITATRSVNFGTLNAGAATTATRSANYMIRCTGSPATATFVVDHDSGENESAPYAPRMRNTAAPTEFLPYSLSLSDTVATIPTNTNYTITVTVGVAPADVQDATGGSYADRVAITVAP